MTNAVQTFIDPHIHVSARTTDDYQAMASAGIRAVVEPAFWIGQPRTSLGTMIDYFQSLLGWERFRAGQFGIRHFCALGLNAKEANNERLAGEVLDILPRFLVKEGVVAVGEIGFDEQSPAEERAFARQLELAKEHALPVIIHSPHRDKKAGIARSIALCREVGVSDQHVIMDHNTEETLPLVLDTGMWAGHTLYPHTKMEPARMVKLVQRYGHERVIINSSADWGISDPLAVPKTAQLMREAGIAPDRIRAIVWENPLKALAASAQMREEDLTGDPVAQGDATFAGSTVLRGQNAQVLDRSR